MSDLKPKEYNEEEVLDETTIGLPYKVILYNDEFHSFDEVINQLMKAINCSYQEARGYAFETHVKGKSVVFSGELNICLKVTSILEEISLHTQIVS
ncbi:MAG: ATP-dependent Clp protease adaptor ClpS [Melioribacteraceae bacterium]|nr:ATP-dependent Clp protease adaptor ClpS [Melioribacteraceae bacterium]